MYHSCCFSFQHKVGLFYDAESLNSRLTARSLVEESPDESYSNVKCYACDLKKVRLHPRLPWCRVPSSTRHAHKLMRPIMNINKSSCCAWSYCFCRSGVVVRLLCPTNWTTGLYGRGPTIYVVKKPRFFSPIVQFHIITLTLYGRLY